MKNKKVTRQIYWLWPENIEKIQKAAKTLNVTPSVVLRGIIAAWNK